MLKGKIFSSWLWRLEVQDQVATSGRGLMLNYNMTEKAEEQADVYRSKKKMKLPNVITFCHHSHPVPQEQ